MQIRDATANAIAQTYTRQVGALNGDAAARIAARQTEARPRTDSVALSSTTRQLMQFREIAASHSEVRADHVAEIRARLASGSYKIDSNALAARMLG